MSAAAAEDCVTIQEAPAGVSSLFQVKYFEPMEVLAGYDEKTTLYEQGRAVQAGGPSGGENPGFQNCKTAWLLPSDHLERDKAGEIYPHLRMVGRGALLRRQGPADTRLQPDRQGQAP